MKEVKVCTKCKEEKSLLEFHKNSRSKDGLAYKCKVCTSRYMAKVYINNCETLKASSRKRQSTKEYKEKRNNRLKKDRDLNREKYNKNAREFRIKNPGYDSIYKVKRRFGKRLASVSWAKKSLIKEIYLQARTLNEQSGVKYAVDHMVPLNSELVCGLHCEYNLQIIPESENNKKGNRYWPDMP